MTMVVYRVEMAEILKITEAELTSLEAEGMPGVFCEEWPGGVVVRRYDTGPIIEWYVKREIDKIMAPVRAHVRRRSAH